jgi:phosphoribosylglycinamide formyltransferase-1
VLASGGGTNLQAILDRCRSGETPATVVVVIGNNSRAGALDRARRAGIDTLHLSGTTHPRPGALDEAVRSALVSRHVDLVVLAGYMKKLGQDTLSTFRDRIINVHPALLPSFGGQGMYGLSVHAAVLAAGARFSGATVHIVREDYDTGPVLAQEVVPVLPGDTAETLASRVLEVEHALLPSVIRAFAEDRVRVAGDRAVIVPPRHHLHQGMRRS